MQIFPVSLESIPFPFDMKAESKQFISRQISLPLWSQFNPFMTEADII